MDDFDDFYDDGFEEDFMDDFSEDSGGGFQDEPANECEGWCFGDDLEDFAILGGFIGYLEEEIEERKRLERELKKKEEESSCCDKRDGDEEDIPVPPDPEEFIP
jgi:hypothetical protein